MSETVDKKRKYLLYAAVLFLVVLLLSSGLLILDIWDNNQGVYKSSSAESLESSIQYNGETYILNGNIETFLVIGLDKFEDAIDNSAYNNDQQADFIMLFVLDNEKAQYSAIQINRDTITEINVLGVAGQKVDTVNKQIALSHTYGNGKEVSCRNTADAVSKLLSNIRVNHYASLTMDSVPVINDLVGGVEVTVLDDFSGMDDTLIKGETVTLLGEHSLNYVRTRYGLEDSSNSRRMERQRQYLEALFSKVQDCAESDDQFIIEMSKSISEYLVSDCSISQLQGISEKLGAYEFTGIQTIDGESIVGEEYMEFYPEENSLNEIVVDLFYERKE